MSQTLDAASDDVGRARQVLASLNKEDDEYIPALHKLADYLMSRFAQSQSLYDVDEAVSLSTQGLALAPLGHPSHLTILFIAGQALNARYRSQGDAGDLTQAVSYLEAAVNLCAPEQSFYLPLVATFISCLRARYQTYGDVTDLDCIVETSSIVLSATSATSFSRDVVLNNLANALVDRFSALGNRADLETALTHYQSCLDLRPPGHPSRHSVLGNLADAMVYRFDIDGHLQDLESAANHFASALALCSPGQRGYLIHLRNLGTVFWRLFNARGDAEKLEMAMGYFQTAMVHSTVPTLDHSRLLDNYSAALQARHLLLGHIEDLDQAIQHLTTSSKIQPLTYTGRPITLLTLGAALLNRFGATGNTADLDSSVKSLLSAIQLAGPQHQQHHSIVSVYCRALSLRFHARGDRHDIELVATVCKEALATVSPQGIAYPSTVANLTVTLMDCAHESGNIDDCRFIIDHCDRALVSVLPADPASMVLKFTRAKAFRLLFEHGRERTDIDACVDAFRDMIPALHEGHAQYVPVHLNLGIALDTRSQFWVDMKDLEESIALYRMVHRICKRGDMDYINIRIQLGNALLHHFQSRDDDEGDSLDEAIVLLAEAEEMLAPTPEHVEYRTSIVNLGLVHFARFQAHSRKDDLDAAIEHMSRALSLPTSSQGFLLQANIATLFSVRYDTQKDWNDLERSMDHFRVAMEQMPAKHVSRGDLCRNYGHALYKLAGRGKRDDRLQCLENALVCFGEALGHLPKSHFDQPVITMRLAETLFKRANLLCDNDGLNYVIGLLRKVTQTLPEGSPAFHAVYEQAASLSLSIYESVELRDPTVAEDMFRYLEKAARYGHSYSFRSVSAAIKWAEFAEALHHPSVLRAYQTSLDSLHRHLLTAASLKSRRTALVASHWSKPPVTVAMDAAACAIARGQLELAVELSEHGRGLLWSQLSQSKTSLDDLGSANEEGRTLAADFERVSAELSRSIITQSEPTLLTPSRLRVEEAARRYRHMSEELEDIIARIRQQPGFASFLTRPAFERVKRAAIGGPVIMVNISRQRCDALIVVHDGPPRLVPLPDTSFDEVTALSTQLYRALRATSGVGEEKMRERELAVVLRALWDTIVRPIVDALAPLPHGARIWWCPTWTLTTLPLHAAGPYRKGARNLANLYVSSYTPTLTALVRAREHPASGPPSMVAIGQAAPASGGAPLQTVDAELRLVASHVPRGMHFTALSGDASTADAALAALGTHTWAHLACHGRPDVDQPFDAAFALRDRPVTVLDIVRARGSGGAAAAADGGATDGPGATGPAEFAFLSACHTTVGDRDAPDEIIHLAAAMQFAGFRSVIGTMWAVDDGMAREMVDAFYEQLSVGAADGDNASWDCTAAARALSRASKAVDRTRVSLDQRIVFIHIGA